MTRLTVVPCPLPHNGEAKVQLPLPGKVVYIGFRLLPRLVMAQGEPAFDESPCAFVEIDPDNKTAYARRFAVLLPDQALNIRPGDQAAHVGTAISGMTGTVVHVYELTEKSS